MRQYALGVAWMPLTVIALLVPSVVARAQGRVHEPPVGSAEARPSWMRCVSRSRPT